MSVPYYPVDLNNLTGTCTGYEFLVFNNTNIPLLTPCTAIDYICYNNRTTNPNATYADFAIYNSSTGPAPSNCNSWAYNLDVDPTFNGSLILPNITRANQVHFSGVNPSGCIDNDGWCRPEDPANITRIEIPDLVTVGGFTIQYADKIEAVKVPKLSSIEMALVLDLSGFNGSSPPGIDLSFDSLVNVSGIYLTGNIDSISFPALNNTRSINVTTTGILNCTEFANQVVNRTMPVHKFSESNDTVICNSKDASVTTRRLAPTATGKSGGDRSYGVSLKMVMIGIFIGVGNMMLG